MHTHTQHTADKLDHGQERKAARIFWVRIRRECHDLAASAIHQLLFKRQVSQQHYLRTDLELQHLGRVGLFLRGLFKLFRADELRANRDEVAAQQPQLPLVVFVHVFAVRRQFGADD